MTRISLADSASESALQTAVLHMCRWLGVLAYHTHDSRRSQPGFPDLVICGKNGVLFRELKTAKGRLSAGQCEWTHALDVAGADVAVWRPSDLRSGRIQKELEGIR